MKALQRIAERGQKEYTPEDRIEITAATRDRWTSKNVTIDRIPGMGLARYQIDKGPVVVWVMDRVTKEGLGFVKVADNRHDPSKPVTFMCPLHDGNDETIDEIMETSTGDHFDHAVIVDRQGDGKVGFYYYREGSFPETAPKKAVSTIETPSVVTEVGRHIDQVDRESVLDKIAAKEVIRRRIFNLLNDEVGKLEYKDGKVALVMNDREYHEIRIYNGDMVDDCDMNSIMRKSLFAHWCGCPMYLNPRVDGIMAMPADEAEELIARLKRECDEESGR